MSRQREEARQVMSRLLGPEKARTRREGQRTPAAAAGHLTGANTGAGRGGGGSTTKAGGPGRERGQGGDFRKFLKCWVCGKEGHRKLECPDRETVVCDHCERRGHVESACFQKHPELRPPGRTQAAEGTAGMATREEEVQGRPRHQTRTRKKKRIPIRTRGGWKIWDALRT